MRPNRPSAYGPNSGGARPPLGHQMGSRPPSGPAGRGNFGISDGIPSGMPMMAGSFGRGNGARPPPGPQRNWSPRPPLQGDGHASLFEGRAPARGLPLGPRGAQPGGAVIHPGQQQNRPPMHDMRDMHGPPSRPLPQASSNGGGWRKMGPSAASNSLEDGGRVSIKVTPTKNYASLPPPPPLLGDMDNARETSPPPPSNRLSQQRLDRLLAADRERALASDRRASSRVGERSPRHSVRDRSPQAALDRSPESRSRRGHQERSPRRSRSPSHEGRPHKRVRRSSTLADQGGKQLDIHDRPRRTERGRSGSPRASGQYATAGGPSRHDPQDRPRGSSRSPSRSPYRSQGGRQHRNDPDTARRRQRGSLSPAPEKRERQSHRHRYTPDPDDDRQVNKRDLDRQDMVSHRHRRRDSETSARSIRHRNGRHSPEGGGSRREGSASVSSIESGGPSRHQTDLSARRRRLGDRSPLRRSRSPPRREREDRAPLRSDRSQGGRDQRRRADRRLSVSSTDSDRPRVRHRSRSRSADSYRPSYDTDRHTSRSGVRPHNVASRWQAPGPPGDDRSQTGLGSRDGRADPQPFDRNLSRDNQVLTPRRGPPPGAWGGRHVAVQEGPPRAEERSSRALAGEQPRRWGRAPPPDSNDGHSTLPSAGISSPSEPQSLQDVEARIAFLEQQLARLTSDKPHHMQAAFADLGKHRLVSTIDPGRFLYAFFSREPLRQEIEDLVVVQGQLVALAIERDRAMKMASGQDDPGQVSVKSGGWVKIGGGGGKKAPLGNPIVRKAPTSPTPASSQHGGHTDRTSKEAIAKHDSLTQQREELSREDWPTPPGGRNAGQKSSQTPFRHQSPQSSPPRRRDLLTPTVPPPGTAASRPPSPTSVPASPGRQDVPETSQPGSASPPSLPATPAAPQPDSRRSRESRDDGEVYQKLAQVGEGTYGKVYKARSSTTGSLFALKRIRMEGEKDGFPVTAMREIRLLQGMDHPNVIKLYEMMVSKGSVYMVFDYMDHDLTGVLSQPQFEFEAQHLKSLCQQMLLGLSYLHTNGILHRDMKGSNILLNARGELKLADFGLARVYHKRRQRDYTNRVITLWYRSPELLLGETVYGPCVDIWSAGCIMLELFVRKPIFAGTDEIHQLEVIYSLMGTPSEVTWPGVGSLPWYELVKPKEAVASGFAAFAVKWDLSDGARDVAAGLLRMDPAARLSADAALAMPYFVSEAPPPELPSHISRVQGEWHEMEAKQERARKRHRESDSGGTGAGVGEGKGA